MSTSKKATSKDATSSRRPAKKAADGRAVRVKARTTGVRAVLDGRRMWVMSDRAIPRSATWGDADLPSDLDGIDMTR